MRALKTEKGIFQRPWKLRAAFPGLELATEQTKARGLLIVLSRLDLGITTQEGDDHYYLASLPSGSRNLSEFPASQCLKEFAA